MGRVRGAASSFGNVILVLRICVISIYLPVCRFIPLVMCSLLQLGSGFSAARMRGSEHNDPIHPREQRQTPPFSVLCTRERRPCNCQREAEKENQMEMQVNTQETRGDGDSRRRTVEACADAAVNLKCQTNHAGGTLGGISTGE